MASTSTNKQPMMVDRPFLRGAFINSATTIVADTPNPNFANLIQLVRVGDLPSEDGAIVEDIFIHSNEGYPDDSGVRTCALGLYVYMPDQAAPATSQAIQFGKVEIGLSGSVEGFPRRPLLPAVIAPVPRTGDVQLVDPISIGKNSALYLEKGYILCVGYLGDGPNADAGGLSLSGISIFAQGGFY